ncbi:aromatic prenyltransferase [Streptomyces sp. NPDC048594]|uniref:aromatic prenyltransferase n=1 Tax=Streptomyces sp. NPDC048594 TaxID=3365575 RepID=UPI003722E129
MPTGRTTDLARFLSDLEVYAKLAEVDFDDRTVEQVVDVFAEQFATGTITVRTTTHEAPRRDVNFRYMDPDSPHDPVGTARAHGLLPDADPAVMSLLAEVTEKIPLWWGLDASVGHGVQKVWAFFEQPLEFAEIASLENTPRSLRDHRERFREARIDRFSIMGFDFRDNTTNLYSEMVSPGYFEQEEVDRMIRDMGSLPPDNEETRRCRGAINVYYTFDWNSPQARRLCFAVPSREGEFPSHLHPLAARFAAEAPVQAERRELIFNPTFGARGSYLKMEADYTGDAASRVFGYWNR